MAEPAPARREGTADMIAAVIGDMARAMPATSGKIDPSTYQYDVVALRPRRAKSPTATSARPKATVRLAPKRALSLGVIGATMIMIGAIGRKRIAVSSAV